ncbi:ArnT family glycosyltransferase [Paraconexibacter sp.]|uniref:ArnT family glycosyltransferase n=1 Tax=Paraconexibacter sp. TaxID=2949640 RepID=UPI0035636D53
MQRLRPPTSFRGRLLLIAGAALVLRVAYVAIVRQDLGFGDAYVYWLDAQHLADGKGFQHPFEDAPTAEHPPLHIVLLAGLNLLGLDGYQEQKVALAFVGSLTVVLIALLARDVAGERVGLIAGGLAAVYPNLITADGSLMSETLYLVFVVAALIVAWRFTRRPDLRGLALVGALVGLAALTRGEAIALVPLLILPLAWFRGPDLRRRVALATAGVAAFVVVLTPWTVRNLTVFEEPVLISSNGNAVFVGANCDRTYYGDLIGSWAFSCYGTTPPGDESQRSNAYRERGLEYMRDHLGRLPLVVAARAGRALEVYRPGQGVFLQATEGRAAWPARLGIGAFWALLVLAVGAIVRLGVRRLDHWVLLAPIVMATITCLTAYGSTRLRIAAEPSLVVLAAISLDALWRGARTRRRPARSAPPPASAPAG